MYTLLVTSRLKAKVTLPFLTFLSLPAWPLSEQGMEPQKDANAHGTLPAIACQEHTIQMKSIEEHMIQISEYFRQDTQTEGIQFVALI
jgi:hypothetical protein